MMLKLVAVLLTVLSVIAAQKHHQQQQQQHHQQQHHQQPQQQQQQPTTDPRYKQIPIVNVENVLEVDGKFRYSYEGGDGTRAAQDGQQIVVNNQVGTASQGQYTYQGDDGKTYSVTYIADENGYRPIGDHLPTPPPVPAAIARALAHLATLPPKIENGRKF
ncbi:endocuticle structural glycoprotein SgAbd-3-like [Anopheles darlingi]|uniref:endocuticle structural glycoprotein SgAbd-3-like n=1 Tax=Anopheles darlingi TaxID=43151 RepID=UPI002100217A|nr:endocuticle structural glycoprotein SgAbd-3-like [Anopheles darlingi]